MSQLDGRRPLIFIAEDDRAILELIETRLQLAGYLTAHARSGWDAVRGINEIRPHAAILDINMPGLDGFAVLRHLKQAPGTADIPVMVLTARNAPEDVQQAVRLGARDFLTKPFDDAQMLARLARLLRQRPAPTKTPPTPVEASSLTT